MVRQPRCRTSARYYICVALLVTAVVGLRALASFLDVTFRKQAVELKLPLAALDWHKLEPEYRQHLIQPAPLDGETLQNLGTEEYLQVRLLAEGRAARDLTCVATVFITYYTGQPDLVPHVPDECYLAGGYDRVGPTTTETVSVPSVGAPDDRIPVRVLQFQSREGEDRPTVLYFFHANGEYLTTRTQVRWRLARLFESYAYYAKIEVTFANDLGSRSRHPDPEEALEALGPLLRKLMPVLLEDHFAWELVESGSKTAGAEWN